MWEKLNCATDNTLGSLECLYIYMYISPIRVAHQRALHTMERFGSSLDKQFVRNPAEVCSSCRASAQRSSTTFVPYPPNTWSDRRTRPLQAHASVWLCRTHGLHLAGASCLPDAPSRWLCPPLHAHTRLRSGRHRSLDCHLVNDHSFHSHTWYLHSSLVALCVLCMERNN
jgi:hypothetical protein